jgi:hypothetical protein
MKKVYILFNLFIFVTFICLLISFKTNIAATEKIHLLNHSLNHFCKQNKIKDSIIICHQERIKDLEK